MNIYWYNMDHKTKLASLFSNTFGFTVHTTTRNQRCQIYPLWRAFSKSYIFIALKHRLSVEERPNRREKYMFSNENILVRTWPNF